MLFLRGDRRITSSTYALLQTLDVDSEDPQLRHLRLIQTVVAYLYSLPNGPFNDPFLGSESASMIVLSPEPVSIFLLRPEHHTEKTDFERTLEIDEWHRVAGYYGRYNFNLPLWVAPGSRIYPLVTNLVLNDSQDFSSDISHMLTSHRLGPLQFLLKHPDSDLSDRVLTALSWYNRATSYSRDESASILTLSIAFETLLSLPKDAKTDRFVDAISLILGRVTRLETWAIQFYDARSSVVHSGRATAVHFVPPKHRQGIDSNFFEPLLAYGLTIFHLCVSTLLFGAELAMHADLENRFITNNERFIKIIRVLEDESISLDERFQRVGTDVTSIRAARYSREFGLQTPTLLAAVQRAARSLLDQTQTLSAEYAACFNEVASLKSAENVGSLSTLKKFVELSAMQDLPLSGPIYTLRRLADLAWDFLQLRYYWLLSKGDE